MSASPIVVLYLVGVSVFIPSVFVNGSNHLCDKGENVEFWQYTTVHPKAHMFWWIYCTTNTAGYNNVPLVLWLQGGPGASSVGFGNFAELGPLDVNLKSRNTTWLQEVNLLFVDNPVGSGYSYVEPGGLFATNVAEVAQDLLTTIKDVLQQLPQFQTTPFYIFSESYGGKMTAAFSQVLLQAVQQGLIKCNFQGFAMGDSWISPIDSVLTWGPYLYATSLVDEQGLARINSSAMAVQHAEALGEWKEATVLWQTTEDIIDQVTGGVNFYNILKWGEDERIRKALRNMKQRTSGTQWNTTLGRLYSRHTAVMYGDTLSDLMNGPIRKKLAIIPDNVTWGGQSGEVFDRMSRDFMKNVISTVDLMLNTKLKVVVYSGQLDLIVDTLGTELWVQRLQWASIKDFLRSSRVPLQDSSEPGVVQAYVKQYQNLAFYWIMNAGHMVPTDNGKAAMIMLKKVTKQPWN